MIGFDRDEVILLSKFKFPRTNHMRENKKPKGRKNEHLPLVAVLVPDD